MSEKQVNPSITDAVTQANVKNLADAPAMAIGSLYQAQSHSLGLAFENGVNAQQQLFMASQAATVTGVSELYTLDTAEQAVAASNINLSALPEFITAILGVLQTFSGGQS